MGKEIESGNKERKIIDNIFIQISEKDNTKFKSGKSYSTEVDKGLIFTISTVAAGIITGIIALVNKKK